MQNGYKIVLDLKPNQIYISEPKPNQIHILPSLIFSYKIFEFIWKSYAI